VTGFLCKRCVDKQLFLEVVAMKEIMISSLDNTVRICNLSIFNRVQHVL